MRTAASSVLREFMRARAKDYRLARAARRELVRLGALELAHERHMAGVRARRGWVIARDVVRSGGSEARLVLS